MSPNGNAPTGGGIFLGLVMLYIDLFGREFPTADVNYLLIKSLLLRAYDDSSAKNYGLVFMHKKLISRT